MKNLLFLKIIRLPRKNDKADTIDGEKQKVHTHHIIWGKTKDGMRSIKLHDKHRIENNK